MAVCCCDVLLFSLVFCWLLLFYLSLAVQLPVEYFDWCRYLAIYALYASFKQTAYPLKIAEPGASDAAKVPTCC